MTERTRPLFIALTTLALVVATASSAVAGDTTVYDWTDDEVPVVIDTEEGLLMFGQSGEPVRAYSWNETTDERDRPVRLLDFTGDGSLEIIGSGTPTFVIDASGVPEFHFEDGCDQVAVADMIRDSEMDLFCVQGTEVALYTHTGSRAWSADIGRHLDYCSAGDLTGDTQPDIECKIRHADQFIRFSPDGEILDASAENEGIQNPENPADQIQGVDEGVWTGEQSFDLDGDGAAGETIHAADGGLEIRKEGADEPLATIDTGAVQGATVTEFDDREGQHVVVATADTIYVVGQGGEDVREFPADPAGYNRVPHAEFDSLHANGFGEADGDVQEMVRGAQDDIAQCYGSRLRTAPFAGTGRYLIQVHVGEDGSVQNINERHSGVDDDAIESCVQDAVRGLDFPGAEEGRAIINLNVVFSFRDEAS